MASLMKKITRDITSSVTAFTARIAEKYNLDQDELLDLWSEQTKMKIKTATSTSATAKPKSAYLVFCAEQRAILKAEQPDLSFAAISTEIGIRWKAHKEGGGGTTTVTKSDLLARCAELGIKIAKSKSVDAIRAAIREAEEAREEDFEKSDLLARCADLGIKIAKSESIEAIRAAITEAEEADEIESDSEQ